MQISSGSRLIVLTKLWQQLCEEERNSLRSVSPGVKNKWIWLAKKLKHANFWIWVSLRQPAGCLLVFRWASVTFNVSLLFFTAFVSVWVCASLATVPPFLTATPFFTMPVSFPASLLPHLSIAVVHSVPVRCLISEPTRMWSCSTSCEHKTARFVLAHISTCCWTDWR